ncbi:unnamed protein product, partial [marine sediment metagenome]
HGQQSQAVIPKVSYAALEIAQLGGFVESTLIPSP